MGGTNEVMSKETKQTKCLVAFMTEKYEFQRILGSAWSYQHAKLNQVMQRDGSSNN